MLKSKLKLLVPVLMLIAFGTGCAGKKGPAVIPTVAGGGVVTIEAGGYRFNPSLVQVEGPGPIILQVINKTGSDNNLTLKDPAGKIIKSVNIKARETVISNIELSDPGSYGFYCNKRLRATMGMKGRIVVGKAN